MEHLPRNGSPKPLLKAGVVTFPIDRIARQGIPDVLKVHANLMSATGVDLGLHQSGSGETLQKTERSSGITTVFIIHHDAHPMIRMSGECGADFSPLVRQLSTHDG